MDSHPTRLPDEAGWSPAPSGRQKGTSLQKPRPPAQYSSYTITVRSAPSPGVCGPSLYHKPYSLLSYKSSLRQLPNNRSGFGSPFPFATMRRPRQRDGVRANEPGQPEEFVVFNRPAEPSAVEADKTLITPQHTVPPLLPSCIDLPNSARSNNLLIPPATDTPHRSQQLGAGFSSQVSDPVGCSLPTGVVIQNRRWDCYPAWYGRSSAACRNLRHGSPGAGARSSASGAASQSG